MLNFRITETWSNELRFDQFESQNARLEIL